MSNLALSDVYAAIRLDVNSGVAAEIFADQCHIETLTAGLWVAVFENVPCKVTYKSAPFPFDADLKDSYLIKLPMRTTNGDAITVSEGQQIRVLERGANDPELLFEVVTVKRRTGIFTEVIARQTAIGLGDGSGDFVELVGANATCFLQTPSYSIDGRYRATPASYANVNATAIGCIFEPVTAAEMDVENRIQAKGDYTVTISTVYRRPPSLFPPTVYTPVVLSPTPHDRIVLEALTVNGLTVRPALTLEIVGILHNDGQTIKLDCASLLVVNTAGGGNLLTEGGDNLLTEGGDNLVLE